uniref:Uncharacterized protein n=1 Tax=Steinernema glaseri TaxID=37863 RepID=A0A1I7YIL5_9BILA
MIVSTASRHLSHQRRDEVTQPDDGPTQKRNLSSRYFRPGYTSERHFQHDLIKNDVYRKPLSVNNILLSNPFGGVRCPFYRSKEACFNY